jgi:hypothetical protein
MSKNLNSLQNQLACHSKQEDHTAMRWSDDEVNKTKVYFGRRAQCL